MAVSRYFLLYLNGDWKLNLLNLYTVPCRIVTDRSLGRCKNGQIFAAAAEYINAEAAKLITRRKAFQPAAIGKRIVGNIGNRTGNSNALKRLASVKRVASDILKSLGKLNAFEVVSSVKGVVPHTSYRGRNGNTVKPHAACECELCN